jgi:Protein of unknown function (DUF1059)/Glutaredoxin
MFCAKVKEFLSQRKIEYTDRNIAADESALAGTRKNGRTNSRLLPQDRHINGPTASVTAASSLVLTNTRSPVSSIRGESGHDVLRKAAEHAKTAHNMESIPPDIVEN